MLNKDVPYGLHDTQINQLLIEQSSIKLYFNRGVYQLSNDKEIALTPSCFIQLEICNFTFNNCHEHLEIIHYKRKKYFEGSIDKFIHNVKNMGFDIDIDYYSSFAKSMLLRGFIGKIKTDIMITDINKISIIFT